MPSHQQAAKALDMSVATISRLRAGERVPGLPGMAKIEKVLGWSVADQVTAAWHNGIATWQQEFVKRLEKLDEAGAETVSSSGSGLATED